MKTLPKMEKKFIESQIWSLSISAAFQRGNVYKKDSKLSDEDKTTFKSELKTIIDNKVPHVKQEDFISLLESTKDEINGMIKQQKFSYGIGNDGSLFRFGTLQKLFNLYLKYQWCLGWRPEPPHCPFDGIILRKLGNHDATWTTSDDVSEYSKWVKLAKDKAKEKDLSIAQWELNEWSEWLEQQNKTRLQQPN